MNAAKAILKSGLAAVGNPPLVTKVYHPMENDPLKVYTAVLTPETLERLSKLEFNFHSVQDLLPMVKSPEGVTVELAGNSKHNGALVRITSDRFEVKVGTEWRRIVSSCKVIGIPLGLGKFHMQFSLQTGHVHAGNYVKVL